MEESTVPKQLSHGGKTKWKKVLKILQTVTVNRVQVQVQKQASGRDAQAGVKKTLAGCTMMI